MNPELEKFIKTEVRCLEAYLKDFRDPPKIEVVKTAILIGDSYRIMCKMHKGRVVAVAKVLKSGKWQKLEGAASPASLIATSWALEKYRSLL